MKENSVSGIFVSIRPEFVERIINRSKNHEFRKYKPKFEINTLWIYVTSPVSKLQYIAEIASPTEYPNKINTEGFGNTEFNNGQKISKYAYHIIHLHEIKPAIPLKILREKFKFYPPQSYAYTETYKELLEHIQRNHCLEKLF